MRSFPLLLALALVFALPATAQEMEHGGEHHGDHDPAMHHEMPPMRGNDAPRASPNAGAMYTIGTTKVMVHYGRPSVRERVVFGSGDDALVPYGQVWRTGANEATAITTTGPLTIGTETLPAGTYGLFTIPGETEWTVIFNTVAEQWGAMGYDMSKDALRTTVGVASGEHQEEFEIRFESMHSGAVMTLAWADVVVPITMSVSE